MFIDKSKLFVLICSKYEKKRLSVHDIRLQKNEFKFTLALCTKYPNTDRSTGCSTMLHVVAS